MKRIALMLCLILWGALAGLSQTVDKTCAASFELLSDPQFLPDTGEEGVFTAKTDWNLEKRTVSYIWTVTGGKIIEGQNTASIRIFRESDTLTVAVKLRIEPDNCVLEETVGSFIDRVYPILVNQYGTIPPSEEKANLDAFFEKLKKDPNAQGYIFVTDDKNLKRRLKFLLGYIDLKKIKRSYINFLIGRNYEFQTALWLVPAGATYPECKDCLDIRADDTKRLQNIYQLKLKS
jgi:hypothetical protein